MTTNNIFIIDSRVADYQRLMAALPVGSEAFLLNPDQDGIEQMQATLSNYSDLDSIQIISHGAQGALYWAIPFSVRTISTTTAISLVILAAAWLRLVICCSMDVMLRRATKDASSLIIWHFSRARMWRHRMI